jgi:hypothetical protein
MAFKAGSVDAKPDLACIGTVTKVGDAKLSKKGVYSVIALELKGQRAAFNATAFFIYRPEWFRTDFDPKTEIEDVTAELEDGSVVTTTRAQLMRQYCQRIQDKKNTSELEALMAGKPNGFAKLGEAFDGLTTEPTTEGVGQILKEHLSGAEVGYVLTQRKDEDGELMEQYNVQKFFPATDDGIEGMLRSASSSKRTRPIVITWDEN